MGAALCFMILCLSLSSVTSSQDLRCCVKLSDRGLSGSDRGVAA